MLSLQEISDRLEIQQLLVDYSTALDQRRFDDLDAVFTPDAYIDYRVTGGIDGRFPAVKKWLAEVLPNFPAYSHMLGNFDIRVAGDSPAGSRRSASTSCCDGAQRSAAYSRRAEMRTSLCGRRIFTLRGCSGRMSGCLLRDSGCARSHT